MSYSYTKLFSSITESTIWCEPAGTRLVWIAMLAKVDRHGRVFGAIPGIARLANVTLAEAEAAITTLMAPDPYSRTPDNDGRRIEPIPEGGWRLLNYAKYREITHDEDERERKRRVAAEIRERRKVAGSSGSSGKVAGSSGSSDESRHADADSDADAGESKAKAPRAPENPEPPTPEDPPADRVGTMEGHSQEDVDKAIEDGKKPVEAAKALKAAGCVDVHSTRPELVQALADGITIPELVAIAEQHRGKPLVYLISTARRRRQDATAAAGSTSPGKPEPKCNPDGMSPLITDPDEIKRRQAEADAAMRLQYPELYAHLNGASA